MSDEIFPADDRVVEFKRAIEATVLVSHDPVAPEILAQLLEQPVGLVERWCEELASDYTASGRGFELTRVAGGYRYQSHPDLTPYVERFVLHDQKARLSGAALETLAIIAYKQPISRAQVASIRGVDPDGVIRTLQARGYIAESGRDDGPGQAVLFGTTEAFLEKLGLDSLDDLPPIAEFIPGADVVETLEQGLRIDPEIVEPAGAPGPTDSEQSAPSPQSPDTGALETNGGLSSSVNGDGSSDHASDRSGDGPGDPSGEIEGVDAHAADGSPVDPGDGLDDGDDS